MISLRKTEDSEISTMTDWFYNPVALFLSAPESNYPVNKDEMQKELIQQRDTFSIVLDDKTLLGSISINNNTVSHFFIAPSFRGNSYAKDALKCLQKTYNSVLKGWIEKDQREIIQLFETCGFINTDEQRSYTFEKKEHDFILFLWEPVA